MAKTETLTILEIDALTGEETIRELTTDELAQIEIVKKIVEDEKKLVDTKATVRASALAKLKELGLTEAEIAAL